MQEAQPPKEILIIGESHPSKVEKKHPEDYKKHNLLQRQWPLSVAAI